MSMKHSNADITPVEWILIFIGFLLLAVPGSLGTLYIFEGNIITTGVVVLIGIFLFFLLVQIARSGKNRTKNRGITAIEVGSIAIYLLLAYFSFQAIFHFTNVEYATKYNLEKLGNGMIEEIRSLPDKAMELKGEELVKMADRMQEKNSPNNEIESAKQAIETKVDRAINTLKSGDQSLLQRAEFVINNWDRINLHSTYKELNDRLKENVSTLKEIFASPNNPDWQGTFNYNIENKAEAIIASPAKLQEVYSEKLDYYIPVTVCFIAHVLILIPYIVQRRRGFRLRHTGQELEGGTNLRQN